MTDGHHYIVSIMIIYYLWGRKRTVVPIYGEGYKNNSTRIKIGHGTKWKYEIYLKLFTFWTNNDNTIANFIRKSLFNLFLSIIVYVYIYLSKTGAWESIKLFVPKVTLLLLCIHKVRTYNIILFLTYNYFQDL